MSNHMEPKIYVLSSWENSMVSSKFSQIIFNANLQDWLTRIVVHVSEYKLQSVCKNMQ